MGRGPQPQLTAPRPPQPKPPSQPQSLGDDEWVSAEFINTARKFPVLNELRKSVARTETADGWGSAVLVDENTLLLTVHQAHTTKMNLVFSPSPRVRFETTASFVAKDPYLDSSVWELDYPAYVRSMGVKPIRWGHIGNGERKAGDILLGVGFPGVAHGRMNARQHEILQYLPLIKASDEIMTPVGLQVVENISFCKIEVRGAEGPGVSGGGMFGAVTGEFWGDVNPTSKQESHFTPANALWNLYLQARPDVARRYGYRPIVQRHSECNPQARRDNGPERNGYGLTVENYLGRDSMVPR